MASLFWGQANAEPKRQFRFELSFTSRNGNQPGDIPVWTVKTATKPVAEVSLFLINILTTLSIFQVVLLGSQSQ